MAARACGVLVSGLLFLSGCSSLPSSGPTESQFINAQKDPKKNKLGFGIVQISSDLLTILASDSPTPLSTLDKVTDRPTSNDMIGPGDIIQISIYEIGNGLFGGGGSNASGTSIAATMASGSATPQSTGSILSSGGAAQDQQASVKAILSNLPPLNVSADGTVTVPYAGTLHVAGRTVDQTAAMVRQALAKKSQAPQVVVRVVQSVTNSAIVYGNVTRPGRVLLTPTRERLMDVIALAQGSSHPPEDSVIQLTRGNHVARVAMSVPENDPSQNIAIHPGDRIEVIYKPRTFTVFGATGKVSEVPFTVPELSLSEAIARTGGPLDQQSDPNGIFLLRYEDNDVVRRLGLPVAEGKPVTPIVYQIDMMNPGNYFLGQHFVMRDKDMLYYSNAKANNFYKLFALISTIVQPGITAGYMAR
ncbi:capsule polysaccharide export protein [Gluconacetobacter sacchari DSM 12717]|uniref:Polysaccharide export protein n=2 Tax=Gluconacetobacter sacchari TaxID=92759 RepID=A0A7W4NPJ9_9PROT|nr:polysaccharide biosynthesis/export family protein [Gluconacetobacter sacchari]MBB2161714.1 polysaccharide export protein [Gluconacetobacter sacchari]GBQ29477.1 capsule polysaccharide export protein [Gluconacetobacter sacchari DSM 12717]